MTSKEALEKISWRYVNDTSFQEWCEIIKQDLDRLEKLEKVIEIVEDRIEILTVNNWVYTYGNYSYKEFDLLKECFKL